MAPLVFAASKPSEILPGWASPLEKRNRLTLLRRIRFSLVESLVWICNLINRVVESWKFLVRTCSPHRAAPSDTKPLETVDLTPVAGRTCANYSLLFRLEKQRPGLAPALALAISNLLLILYESDQNVLTPAGQFQLVRTLVRDLPSGVA